MNSDEGKKRRQKERRVGLYKTLTLMSCFLLCVLELIGCGFQHCLQNCRQKAFEQRSKKQRKTEGEKEGWDEREKASKKERILAGLEKSAAVGAARFSPQLRSVKLRISSFVCSCYGGSVNIACSISLQ